MNETEPKYTASDGKLFYLRVCNNPPEWDIGVVKDIYENDAYRMHRLLSTGFKARTMWDLGHHIGTASAKAIKLWPDIKITSVDVCPLCAAAYAKNVASPTFSGKWLGARPEWNIPPENQMQVKEMAACMEEEIDILKIDIEQGETITLQQMDALDWTKRFKVVLGEWHFMHAQNQVRKSFGSTQKAIGIISMPAGMM
jgi:hypothetical protein